MVYKQGEKCDKLYLVLDGEFEQTKFTDLGKDKSVNIVDYIGPKSERCKSTNPFKKNLKIKSNLNMLSRGMIIGYEDAVSKPLIYS